MVDTSHKISGVLQLMRLDRPIGSLLLLWPTLWALWLAGRGRPAPGIVLIFIIGVFVMRAAGCTINDYADRNIDGLVKRTAGRPLVTGVISPRQALVLFAGLCTLAFVLVINLNRLTIELSFIGALLAASYPFVKRLTHLPQLYLGLAFGWGIPMAYAAEANTLTAPSWWLL
ncbi:MAG TPA: 4-hydroxybenzoate octaprenyltransferase, partial [Gammaproteobacteria bacterium]|nr:4-hydroxybenzoate octaprenyltransferase [Gammaproteobacteria bacterium]